MAVSSHDQDCCTVHTLLTYYNNMDITGIIDDRFLKTRRKRARVRRLSGERNMILKKKGQFRLNATYGSPHTLYVITELGVF